VSWNLCTLSITSILISPWEIPYKKTNERECEREIEHNFRDDNLYSLKIFELCFFQFFNSISSINVPMPQINTPKYFGKIFLFPWIYSRKYFWLPDNDTRKLQKWSLDYPIFLGLIHKPMHAKIDHSSFLNKYYVLKVVKVLNNLNFRFFSSKINLNVTIPGYFFFFQSIITRISVNFRVMIPGNWLIAGNFYTEVAVSLYNGLTITGYHYPDNVQFLSKDTRKLVDFQVRMLGNQTIFDFHVKIPGNWPIGNNAGSIAD